MGVKGVGHMHLVYIRQQKVGVLMVEQGRARRKN